MPIYPKLLDLMYMYVTFDSKQKVISGDSNQTATRFMLTIAKLI